MSARHAAGYQSFMIFTGVTDRDRGRQYMCPKCRRLYWSTWGNARRHYLKEMEKLHKTRRRTH